MSVKKVYLIFKTHLDIGFTDYASAVLDRYITEFIPAACETARAQENTKSAAVARSILLHPAAHRQRANAMSIQAILFFMAAPFSFGELFHGVCDQLCKGVQVQAGGLIQTLGADNGGNNVMLREIPREPLAGRKHAD